MDVSSLYCKYTTKLSVHKLQNIHVFYKVVLASVTSIYSLKSPLNEKAVTLQAEVGLGFSPCDSGMVSAFSVLKPY